jgi:hypothetical protein
MSWVKTYEPWNAVIFAAFLCLSTVFFSGAFLCFLPMCFVMQARAVWNLRQQVAELECRLDDRDRPTGQAAASLPTGQIFPN